MQGLGDNFYQRAVLKSAPVCDLETAWPELYSDLEHIRCVKPNTVLRTQLKNIQATGLYRSGRFSTRKRIHYDQSPGTILDSMCRVSGIRCEAIDFNGPPTASTGAKPVIVVRPCVIRSEWRADARNPLPEYISQACDALKDEFRIVSVADLEPDKEWLDGDAPFAHERYHSGELSITDLLTLIDSSVGTIGGVGWITPASVAYSVPHLCVFGGWGKPNGPERIFDRRMNTETVVRALPDNFCMCDDKYHACDKTISNFGERIESFRRLAQQRIAVAS